MKRKSEILRHNYAVLLPLITSDADVEFAVSLPGIRNRKKLRKLLRKTWPAYRAGFIAGKAER